MTTCSPIHELHDAAGASFLQYAHEPSPTASPQSPAPLVVETFGELEGEYAALRKGAALMDLPQRGSIAALGSDRVELLNRMLTQELSDLQPFQVRRSFWLNRKGRIDADVRLIHLEDRTLFDLDLLSAEHTTATLSEFVFSEDVVFENQSQSIHRLALHGPAAAALLAEVSEHVDGPAIETLDSGQAASLSIVGQSIVVARDDESAAPGFHLLLAPDATAQIYEALLDAGIEPTPDGRTAAGPYRLRPIGWHAFNIARIEAGTPLFNIDFASTNLPAETGVLDDRVSFTKGCYLGQEIVARMHSLGHPSRTLVGLRIESPQAPENQPITGAELWLPDDESRTPVGAVTSSTHSPMLGNALIAFAQLKWDCAEDGRKLLVQTDRNPLSATVQTTLRFWPAVS